FIWLILVSVISYRYSSIYLLITSLARLSFHEMLFSTCSLKRRLRMKVIAVLNQKGGAGKTTVATHLARAFQLSGAEVLLVDSDPQGSARDWSAVRDDNPVTVVGIDRPTIERDLKSLGRKDFIIIDGAPQAANLAVS